MSYQVLTPLSPQIDELQVDDETPKDLKDDIEILKSDRESYTQLIESILANKRLAWWIVSAYCKRNNYMLAERNYGEEKAHD